VRILSERSQLSLRERTKFGFALAASPGPIIAL
jgi:hypothetical protein